MKILFVSPSLHSTVGSASALCVSYNNLMVLMGQAMHLAGVRDGDEAKCLFVDDTLSNVEAAKGVGWIHSVYFRESRSETVEGLHLNHIAKDQDKLLTEERIPIINSLEQLRKLWPDIFVQAEH